MSEFIFCSLLFVLLIDSVVDFRTDRPLLHIPKSFDELKELNSLLQKLKLLYPIRTVLCFIVTYL